MLQVLVTQATCCTTAINQLIDKTSERRTVMTAWLRLECSFTPVLPDCRAFAARRSSSSASLAECTGASLMPWTCGSSTTHCADAVRHSATLSCT